MNKRFLKLTIVVGLFCLFAASCIGPKACPGVGADAETEKTEQTEERV